MVAREPYPLTLALALTLALTLALALALSLDPHPKPIANPNPNPPGGAAPREPQPGSRRDTPSPRCGPLRVRATGSRRPLRGVRRVRSRRGARVLAHPRLNLCRRDDWLHGAARVSQGERNTSAWLPAVIYLALRFIN